MHSSIYLDPKTLRERKNRMPTKNNQKSGATGPGLGRGKMFNSMLPKKQNGNLSYGRANLSFVGGNLQDKENLMARANPKRGGFKRGSMPVSRAGLGGGGVGLRALDVNLRIKGMENSISQNRSVKLIPSLSMEQSMLVEKKGMQRLPCDPMEFCLDKIDAYYQKLISERGKGGSVACGGDIFSVQKFLKENMRVILFDWLLDLVQKWKMKTRTFILAITFTDAVLMRCTVTREIFQLVGMACLFIAGKFEEIYPPSLDEYLDCCGHAFSREQMLQIETIILNAVQFNLVILNHLDILELNLKQKLKLNSKNVRIHNPNFIADETQALERVSKIAHMFLILVLYDHKVHCLDMNQVVDFCVINALRFSQTGDVVFEYKGVIWSGGFTREGAEVAAFLRKYGGLSLEGFQQIEGLMKQMMKGVFDSRQYGIIIKYRQFFIKILRTYFDMI